MTTAADRINGTLSALASAVDDYNRACVDIESLTPEEATVALMLARDLIGAQRQCEAGFERWIARCFKEEGWGKLHELPGIGMVEVHRSAGRKAWQHERVQADWLNAYMESIGGEVPTPAEVRDAFTKVAGVGYYKVGGLLELGLDPSDYSDSEPGTPKVSIA